MKITCKCHNYCLFVKLLTGYRETSRVIAPYRDVGGQTAPNGGGVVVHLHCYVTKTNFINP